MVSELIKDFLERFAVKAKFDESEDHIELMMDDHHFIIYESKGYYIPETIGIMDEDDGLLHTMILKTYQS
jgi:hypothetical protein